MRRRSQDKRVGRRPWPELALIGVSLSGLVTAGVLAWSAGRGPPAEAARRRDAPLFATQTAPTERAPADTPILDPPRPDSGEPTSTPLQDTAQPPGVLALPLAQNATSEPARTPAVAAPFDVRTAQTPQSAADAGSRAPEPIPPTVASCGLAVCAAGSVCCNPSCGTCVPEGDSCDPTPCKARVQYPVSLACGHNTCSAGEVCCNPSCGTCAAEGAACDQTPCEPRIQLPVSLRCGHNTCSVGEVCCNASCGTCAAEGASCDQAPCRPRIR